MRPRMRRIRGNGVTAGSKNLTYRAHAFRMTLVAQGKLPQIMYLLTDLQTLRGMQGWIVSFEILIGNDD